MKKISKLLALAASVSVLFFAACSDISEDSGSGTVSNGVTDKTSSSNASEYTVYFEGSNGTPLPLSTLGINTSVSSRTIVATDQDLSGYTYYLWGKDIVANSDVDPTEVEFSADSTGDTTKGKVTLDLKVSNYKLVLAAVETPFDTVPTDPSNITDKALYIGYANVDLRNTSSIKFYITSDGLTGEGSFSLKVIYDGLKVDGGTWTEDHVNLVKSSTTVESTTTANYQMTADVLNRSTGESVLSAASSITITDFFGTTGATVSGTIATPGTYNFVVYFKDVLNGNKTYEYSDIIIILPNQTVTDTVKVPDVIEYVPNTPKDLKVGYVTPSTDDIGTYNAVLTWTDNSKNESYFQVEIVDVSRNSGTKDRVLTDAESTASIITANIKTAPADDKESDPSDAGNTASLEAWKAAITNTVTSDKKTYGKDFYGDTVNGWVAGSLQRNNNHIVVKLSLGKSYVMRIAAVNDAGQSRTYAYATYDLSETWTDSDPVHSGSYKAEPFALKELNFATATPFDYAGTDTKFSEPYKVIENSYGYTANLYRLIYNLNGGTLTVKSGLTTKAKVVCYLTQSPTTGIPILTPFNRDVTGITPDVDQEYPMLISNGNRWTSWRKDVVEGTNYDATDPQEDNNITYYKPGNYAGYANLNLFASFAVSQAAVEAYLDRMYDFIDGEIVIDSLTSVGEEVNDHSSIVYNGTTTIKLKYSFNNDLSVNIGETTTSITRKAFTYSSLFAIIKTANSADSGEYARSDFSTGTDGAECSLNIGNLPANKTYQITVIGEYNGHQYSYPLVIKLQDRP